MKNGLQSQSGYLTQSFEIKTITEADWRFNSPESIIQIGTGNKINVSIDPFPCYTHDLEVIKTNLERVQERTVQIPVQIYVSSFETKTRENAFSQFHYKEFTDGKWEKEYIIHFSGKRTPIHPILTKYLVGHEYGHLFEYWYEEQLNLTKEAVLESYADFRNLVLPIHWHKNIQEIFAEDFRVLVAKIDVQYWPHKDVARPETIEGLKEWWVKTINELK